MVVATQTPTQIVKRNGLVVQFDRQKIQAALDKCFLSLSDNKTWSKEAKYVLQARIDDYIDRIINIIGHRYDVPTVEQVQDAVEIVLVSFGEYDAAKHYILYRAERTRIREEESIPEDVLRAFEQDAAYFPTPIQRFQFFDKYARWNTSAGRRETWVETVDRAVDYLRELAHEQLLKDNLGKPNETPIDFKIIDFKEIREYILNMKAMPSMRLLAMAGEPARRDNATLYNCSYLPIDGVDAFCELMSNCMAGCGVGFSVESDNVDKIPKISKQRSDAFYRDDSNSYIIDDSAEGWVQALRDGLTCWISGYDLEFDFSKIRLKGTVLRTKGGQASGPDPLRKLLNFIRDRVFARQGKKLRTIDAHDIACAIGNAVVSGGVRRTALISIFDADDELMLHCKDGDFDKDNPQRWNANNSAVWSPNITQQEFVNRMHSMFSSERGEPGIFSREVAKNTMPSRRDRNHIFGTNPCFAPDTIIETVDGKKKIKDITEPTYVYSMDDNQKLVLKRASASWLTRKDASTVRVYLSNGKNLVVTPEHKIYVVGKGWIEAGKLRSRDRLVGLSRNRRGAAYSGVKLTTQSRDEYVMEHRFIWEGINGQIPVGYDIHHKDDNTYKNMLENFELLTHSEHATLTRNTRPNHQMQDSLGRFMITTMEPGRKTIVDMPDELKTNWHQYATVVGVENGPTTDVYDISVEDTNNLIANDIVAHNCGEIVLRPWQFCNLSIVVARPGDTFKDLKHKVRVATIIGTIQSCATYFPNLRSIWKVNCEQERLLGVDITGQYDNELLNGKSPEFQETIFTELQLVAIETNREYAEKLGINQSASVTCVKPSGNSAQLLNTSSGIHPRWAPYYIRNARLNASSPLVKVFQEAGVPMSPENGQDVTNVNTWVVSFPIKAPEGAPTRKDVSAVAQCNTWLLNKVYWTEHNPSVTITYTTDEVLDLMDWVWKYRSRIGGMTFLPRDDAKYDQLPYIEITEEEYNKRLSEFPTSIPWHKTYLYEHDDRTTAAQELACVANVCEAP